MVGSHGGNASLGQRSVDDTDADTGLLKGVAVLQDACDATSAVWPLPLVFAELLAVYPLELLDDDLLLLLDELLHAQAHGGVFADDGLALLEGIFVGKCRFVESSGVLCVLHVQLVSWEVV